MMNQDFVYSKIGMALVSTQRVEFLTGELLKTLEYLDDSLASYTTEEFLADSKKSKKIRHKTLGMIFRQLKLNPSLVHAKELDEYLNLRNVFVHKFWIEYLQNRSDEEIKGAIDYCYEFGQKSTKLESFFKGLVYSLQRHLSESLNISMSEETLKWRKDYEYFVDSLKS